jgi:hypothetical protein
LCDVKTSLSKPAGGSTGLDGGLGDVEGLGDAEEGGGAGGLVESVELVTSEVLFEDEVAAVEVGVSTRGGTGDEEEVGGTMMGLTLTELLGSSTGGTIVVVEVSITVLTFVFVFVKAVEPHADDVTVIVLVIV